LELDAAMTAIATSMQHRAPTPARVTGVAAVRAYWRFVRDPLAAAIRTHATYGPFAIISDPLPLIKIRRIGALAVGAAFNREVLTNPGTWRTVTVSPFGWGPSGTSARRLSRGIISMNGRRHAHYRRLLAPPLTRESVEARGDHMTRLATEEVESWPLGEVIDLAARARRLVRNFGIGLLFGDDRERAYPITDMISRGVDSIWSLRVAACPINLPITPYGKMVRGADLLERRIFDWAVCMHGHPDPHNLLSIIVNSADENGNRASAEMVVGHMPTLIAATYETCQNALIWTLILLAQHPRVARDLCEELDGRLAGSAPSPDKIAELPLLDAVVKESMRLLPPVPTHVRLALHDTSLAGHAVPKGLLVVLSAFLTNREPDLYENPDRFSPERWETIAPTPFQYPVFGAGLHGCAGSWFGLSAVKVGLAAILARYRIALLSQAIDYKVRVNLSPSGQVLAVLHRQDRAFAPAALRGSLARLVHLAAE
jgi:cytochrome P450